MKDTLGTPGLWRRKSSAGAVDAQGATSMIIMGRYCRRHNEFEHISNVDEKCGKGATDSVSCMTPGRRYRGIIGIARTAPVLCWCLEAVDGVYYR